MRLNPIQEGGLHEDNIWNFLLSYPVVALRNCLQVKSARPENSDVVPPLSGSTGDELRAWWTRLPKKTLALTFDDGPDPSGTPAVLDVLAHHNAKAAFFVLGVAACASPELAIRINLEGHALCYHGWNHQPEYSDRALTRL